MDKIQNNDKQQQLQKLIAIAVQQAIKSIQLPETTTLDMTEGMVEYRWEYIEEQYETLDETIIERQEQEDTK